MRSKSKLAAWTLAGFLALAGAAWADGPTSGEAELDGKDVAAGTIVIGRHTYKVTDGTVIRDREGVAITLADVPIPEADAKVNLREIVSGRFEAVEAREGLVLVSLDLGDPIE